MLSSLMLGCSLIVNIVFVLVFFEMNDLINCYRNRIEDLILELIETHITIDKLKKTEVNAAEIVEADEIYIPDINVSTPNYADYIDFYYEAESEVAEEVSLNENEAMFIDIVKLLDNTIDIAASDKAIQFKPIPLASLLEKSFSMNQYFTNTFDHDKNEKELINYIETVELPEYLNEDDEEAIEEYLAQKEIEFFFNTEFKNSVAFELVMTDMDNVVCNSIVKTLECNFTFSNNKSNCNKCVLNYDKIKKLLNGKLKYINL